MSRWPRRDELRQRLRDVLMRLRLCAAAGGRGFIGVVHTGKPGSSQPPPADDPASSYLAEVERAGEDVGRLRSILRAADEELAAMLRRPLAPIRTETLVEWSRPW